MNILIAVKFFFNKFFSFNNKDSALATIDHDHHKLRRSALNPFFSTQSVRNLQSVIEERVDSLLEALYKFAATQERRPIDILYPFSAFTNGKSPAIVKGFAITSQGTELGLPDVINEYAFARSDHLSMLYQLPP